MPALLWPHVAQSPLIHQLLAGPLHRPQRLAYRGGYLRQGEVWVGGQQLEDSFGRFYRRFHRRFYRRFDLGRLEAEAQPQPGLLEGHLRVGQPLGPAGFQDALKSPPPGLDQAGPKEGVGEVGVEGLGGVLLQQALHRPTRRELTGVPDHQAVGVDADLDGYPAAVVLVHDGVQKGLPQSRLGYRVGLQALQALVGDTRLEVLGLQHHDGLAGLGQEVAPHLVLEAQVHVVLEEADLDQGPGDKAFGVGVKQQDGGPLEVAALQQV